MVERVFTVGEIEHAVRNASDKLKQTYRELGAVDHHDSEAVIGTIMFAGILSQQLPSMTDSAIRGAIQKCRTCLQEAHDKALDDPETLEIERTKLAAKLNHAEDDVVSRDIILQNKYQEIDQGLSAFSTALLGVKMKGLGSGQPGSSGLHSR